MIDPIVTMAVVREKEFDPFQVTIVTQYTYESTDNEDMVAVDAITEVRRSWPEATISLVLIEGEKSNHTLIPAPSKPTLVE